VTFSFGVIWAAILLAPGLSTYSALFAPVRSLAFRPAPPAPNSLTTFGIVIGGALASHMLWLAWLTYGNAWLAGHHLALARLPLDPNVYALALDLLAGGHRVTVDALAYAMLHAVGLTLAAYIAVRLLLRVPRLRRWTRGLLFGHLAALVREVDLAPSAAVIAFVLTKIGDDKTRVGYEGSVEVLSFAADRVIGAITLGGASKFVMRLGYSGFGRVPGAPKEPIELLVIEQAQIENIAFNVYQAMPPGPV